SRSPRLYQSTRSLCRSRDRSVSLKTAAPARETPVRHRRAQPRLPMTGSCFLLDDRTDMGATLGHDLAKWKPVFAQCPDGGSKKAEPIERLITGGAVVAGAQVTGGCGRK